jgi:hypothetical protein
MLKISYADQKNNVVASNIELNKLQNEVDKYELECIQLQDQKN